MIEITQTEHGKATILKVSGRLDASASGSFDGRVSPVVAGSTGHVILDLAGLEYLSSAGVHCILSIIQKLQPASRRLFLAGVQPTVREILHIAGLDRYLSIHGTVEEALSSAGN